MSLTQARNYAPITLPPGVFREAVDEFARVMGVGNRKALVLGSESFEGNYSRKIDGGIDVLNNVTQVGKSPGVEMLAVRWTSGEASLSVNVWQRYFSVIVGGESASAIENGFGVLERRLGLVRDGGDAAKSTSRVSQSKHMSDVQGAAAPRGSVEDNPQERVAHIAGRWKVVVALIGLLPALVLYFAKKPEQEVAISQTSSESGGAGAQSLGTVSPYLVVRVLDTTPVLRRPALAKALFIGRKAELHGVVTSAYHVVNRFVVEVRRPDGNVAILRAFFDSSSYDAISGLRIRDTIRINGPILKASQDIVEIYPARVVP